MSIGPPQGLKTEPRLAYIPNILKMELTHGVPFHVVGVHFSPLLIKMVPLAWA